MLHLPLEMLVAESVLVLALAVGLMMVMRSGTEGGDVGPFLVTIRKAWQLMGRGSSTSRRIAEE